MLVSRVEIIEGIEEQVRKRKETHKPAFAQLANFNAHAIVDKEINYTIVGGRFSPTLHIDLTNQAVLSFCTLREIRPFPYRYLRARLGRPCWAGT